MPGASTLALFAAASLALVVVPGPSVVYIVTRSVAQGRRAGLVSMLGVQAGALVHVAAAAIGLSALLASSATAFSVVKYAGAAYLIWLGIQRLLGGQEIPWEPGAPRAHRRLFAQGVVVNVLNPKTAIFFLAFLPQFVDPDGAAPAWQVLVLGFVFLVIATLSDGAYAVAAGTASARLRASATFRRRLDQASGVILIALGAFTALTGERRA